MTGSTYPAGINNLVIRGMPLTMANPGRVFWASNADVLFADGQQLIGADQAGKGTLAAPFRTIDFAFSQCTANRGDIIIALPGHVEDIASATSFVADIAGVAVIGLGSGSLQPQLNFSATASSVEFDAANVSLINFNLKADISAVVVGVNVNADNVSMIGCKFDFNASGDDFLIMIDVDAVNGFQLVDSTLLAEGIAGSNNAIRLDDCDDVVIKGNHIWGDFTTGCILGESAVGTNLLIDSNTLYNADTTSGFLVDLNVAFTGIMSNNSMGTLFTTAPETAVDPGSMLCLENYVCNNIDESGALVPVAVST